MCVYVCVGVCVCYLQFACTLILIIAIDFWRHKRGDSCGGVTSSNGRFCFFLFFLLPPPSRAISSS